ncbi:hypothetical protein BDF20DRAFT_901540 [Mycotypha africana]|uniref:uncharacterized protein n=1 Tax=Mycotypha africana TaxID=64632 RepID=UPI002300ED5F|nr:uncharacterized protein BDF20DRAFT_901540 [Mycotypha africana]KAI8967271.1 hypothetical protein BDF20DRAFT_901540 [Mycotypha africana]
MILFYLFQSLLYKKFVYFLSPLPYPIPSCYIVSSLFIPFVLEIPFIFHLDYIPPLFLMSFVSFFPNNKKLFPSNDTGVLVA